MSSLAKRTISGIVFVAIMLAGLLLNRFLFAGLVVFVMIVMMLEFYKMTMGDRYKGSRILAILAGVILELVLFLENGWDVPTKLMALTMIPMIVVMINSLFVKDKSEFGLFSYIYTGYVYIAVPLALSNLIAFHDGDFNATLLLAFFAIIWSSDVGAYAFGLSLGQKYGKKMCPSISPKKSWIGFWGGMLTSVIAVIILHTFGVISISLIHCIVLGILMHCGGVCGDLFESMWKRFCNVKDSGNIIPGHGGMMDRFDSALIAIPVGAVYLSLFNLL